MSKHLLICGSLYFYPAKSSQADKIFLATKRHKRRKRNAFLSVLSFFVACIRWSSLGCGYAALSILCLLVAQVAFDHLAAGMLRPSNRAGTARRAAPTTWNH